MSGRVTAVFGAIVLVAMVGLDYGAAANQRPAGDPLGVAEHAMTRFGQAKLAMGFAPPPASVPVTSIGKATAALEAALASANPSAGAPTSDLSVASGDPEAMAAMAEGEFARVAAELEGAAPAAAPKPARKGQITVGIGTCTKGGAGKFCSVAD